MNLEEFATRINADLVGKLVNIASRCASFIHRGHGGRLAAELPDPGAVPRVRGRRRRHHGSLGIARVRRGRARDHGARRPANLYIDRQKPWLAAKDPARAAEVQAVCTQGINLFRVLMTYLKPVLPEIAEQAEAFLGAPIAHWRDVETPLVGTAINEYRPLATRVDAAAVQEARGDAHDPDRRPRRGSAAPQPRPRSRPRNSRGWTCASRASRPRNSSRAPTAC